MWEEVDAGTLRSLLFLTTIDGRILPTLLAELGPQVLPFTPSAGTKGGESTY